MVIYFVILYAASLALSYVLCWDMATRAATRLMEDEQRLGGLLHALTPGWVVLLAIAAAAGSVGWLGYGWWTYDAAAGLMLTVGFVVMMTFNGFVFMPRPVSGHYRRLMTPPLLSRHAHLIGRGKTGNAQVLEQLLERLGMPIRQAQGRPVWLRA